MPINLKVRDRNGERVIEMRQDRATFGRSTDCTVLIEDTMASREHCRIEKVSDSEFKLIDLESRNGTRVNGVHVNQHKLGHGDQIQIGEVTVVFEQQGQARTSPNAPAGQRPSQSRAGSRSKHSTRRVARRRGRGGGSEVAIAGAVGILVISVVALSLTVGGGGGEESAPARILAKAQKAYDEGDYSRAESLCDKISASKHPNLYESSRSLLEKIQQAQRASEDSDRARAALLMFKQVVADQNKGKIKSDKLISRYQEVIRRYPGTDAANQAASKLAGISTGEAKDPLAELAKKALILTKTNEFQQAIDLYQSYWDKTGDEKATAEIKKLNDEGDRAYRDLHQRAQAAISLGDKQRAREFYQEIKRHFGGTWTQQADSELSKIP